MLRDHGNKFAVRRLAPIAGDRAAEDLLTHFLVPAVPRGLDRVPHRALHAGR